MQNYYIFFGPIFLFIFSILIFFCSSLFSKKSKYFTKKRCPMGSKAYGAQCHDINECLEQTLPCLNGGICKNFEDDRMFMCQCPRNYSGHICELEVQPAGILTTSTDFIIALVICILVLLSKSSHVTKPKKTKLLKKIGYQADLQKIIKGHYKFFK